MKWYAEETDLTEDVSEEVQSESNEVQDDAPDNIEEEPVVESETNVDSNDNPGEDIGELNPSDIIDNPENPISPVEPPKDVPENPVEDEPIGDGDEPDITTTEVGTDVPTTDTPTDVGPLNPTDIIDVPTPPISPVEPPSELPVTPTPPVDDGPIVPPSETEEPAPSETEEPAPSETEEPTPSDEPILPELPTLIPVPTVPIPGPVPYPTGHIPVEPIEPIKPEKPEPTKEPNKPNNNEPDVSNNDSSNSGNTVSTTTQKPVASEPSSGTPNGFTCTDTKNGVMLLVSDESNTSYLFKDNNLCRYDAATNSYYHCGMDENGNYIETMMTDSMLNEMFGNVRLNKDGSLYIHMGTYATPTKSAPVETVHNYEITKGKLDSENENSNNKSNEEDKPMHFSTSKISVGDDDSKDNVPKYDSDYVKAWIFGKIENISDWIDEKQTEREQRKSSYENEISNGKVVRHANGKDRYRDLQNDSRFSDILNNDMSRINDDEIGFAPPNSFGEDGMQC